MTARWQLDQWQFLTRVVTYDFVARSVSVIEGHPGTPLYYLNILQKLHLDWLFLAVVAYVVRPVQWRQIRVRFPQAADRRAMVVIVGTWVAATLLIPTMMRTKLPWYLSSPTIGAIASGSW